MASIKKLKTGWQFRVSYKKDNGTYGTVSKNGFRTKGDAQAEANTIELILHKGGDLEAGKIPFETYFINWFKLYKEETLASDKTKTHYHQSQVHIKNYFGKTAIGDITENRYQAFLNDFGKTHAKETTSKLNTHCRACFKRAVKQGAIPHDPGDGAVVTGSVAAKKDQVKFLSEAALNAVVISLMDGLKPNDASRHLLLFSISTGVRFSEAAGITWDSFNFENKTVRIDKTWDYSKNDFGPTKNEASNRLIPIDDFIISLMQQFKEHQARRTVYKKNLVFLSYRSDLPSNNSVNKSLKRAITRAKVSPLITHHGLRHTHVSLLLYKNINIKYISRRIGHATVSTTYDKYAHIIDELEQLESTRTSEIMNQLYINAK